MLVFLAYKVFNQILILLKTAVVIASGCKGILIAMVDVTRVAAVIAYTA